MPDLITKTQFLQYSDRFMTAWLQQAKEDGYTILIMKTGKLH